MEPSSRPKKEFQKKYIRVRVDFRDDGSMLPRSILWEDDREFLVDQVLDICCAPALKAGGQGDRYTVIIGGLERFIFFEHNPDSFSTQPGRWFMEIRSAE